MKPTTSSDAPSPVSDEVVSFARSAPMVTPAPAKTAAKSAKAMPKITAMMSPTTRPARISQPTSLRHRSHALANTSPMLMCSSPVAWSWTRADRPLPPPAVGEFAAVACYPWRRHARLYPQGVPQDRRPGGRRSVAGRRGLRLAARGRPAAGGPPLLPAALPRRQAGAVRAVRRPRRRPRRDHRRRRRRARRHGGLRAGRAPTSSSSPTSAPGTTGRSTPRPPIRRSWRRWSSCACGPRPAGCASWTCPSAARPKRRTA